MGQPSAALGARAVELERLNKWSRLCRAWLPFVDAPGAVSIAATRSSPPPWPAQSFVLEKDPDLSVRFLSHVADPANSIFALYVSPAMRTWKGRCVCLCSSMRESGVLFCQTQARARARSSPSAAIMLAIAASCGIHCCGTTGSRRAAATSFRQGKDNPQQQPPPHHHRSGVQTRQGHRRCWCQTRGAD